ncbi:hypothetical protein PG985_015763 [Apiospora marii]|uniref:uncharacterized protein n=1 Tax=Apiospora marii TaxID=335849 RepID=UPI00312E17E1
MQVNKHLHRGTAFVNWSAQEAASSPSSSSPANSQESGSRVLPIRPVRWHVKPRIQGSRARQTETTSRQETKARKRAVEPGATSATSDQNEAGRAGTGSEGGGPSLSSGYIFPVWASAVFPGDLPDSHKRLLHLSVVYWPIIAYPLGEHALLSYNPLQVPERHVFLFQDPTSLHCLVAMGALYETLRSGRKESFLLGSLVSKLYSVIGDHIRSNGDLNTAMNAMATLALIAGYQGNYEHWSLHMKALMQFIPAAGGLDQVDTGVMGGIRKADFAGALSFSTKPFLPWRRRQAKLQCIPEIGQEAMHRGLTRHLAPCGLGQATIKAVTTVASYHRCITYTKRQNQQKRRRREGAEAVVYEPLEVGEHYDYILYRLLAEPGPLLTTRTALTTSEQQHLNAELLRSDTTSPFSPGDDGIALQSAIRILAILLLREPTNDMPCGESNLLRQLEHHLQTILHSIERTRTKRPVNETPVTIVSSTYPCPSTPQPTLSSPKQKENNDTLATRKPIHLWLCTAGDLVSTLQGGGVTGGRTDKAGRPSIYERLLRAVLSPDEAADPARVRERDLEVCRIMSLGDMREMKLGSSTLRDSGEEGWDDRQAMRRILGLTDTGLSDGQQSQ